MCVSVFFRNRFVITMSDQYVVALCEKVGRASAILSDHCASQLRRFIERCKPFIVGNAKYTCASAEGVVMFSYQADGTTQNCNVFRTTSAG